MKLQSEGKLIRVFLGESDKVNHQPLYEAIVHAAKKKGLAGATVLRGVERYGANSRIIHTAKILRLSEDLPIVVEIVDTEDQIIYARSRQAHRGSRMRSNHHHERGRGNAIFPRKGFGARQEIERCY